LQAALLLGAGLLWWTKGSLKMRWRISRFRFRTTRLEAATVSQRANVSKMKTYLAITKPLSTTEGRAKKHTMLNGSAIGPNEFQTRLRQAIIRTAETPEISGKTAG